MRKIKLAITTLCLGIVLTSCVDSHHHHSNQNQVTCYQTHNSTGEILFWYMLLSPNGNTYYYSSPTVINDYSSISWSNDAGSFNPEQATELSTTSVESNGFSSDMQNNLESQESNGFEGNSSNESTSSDNSSSDVSSSESGGFDGGGDSGGGDGGGGGE